MHDVWIYAATTKLRYVGSYRRVVDSARRVACSLATSLGISTCRWMEIAANESHDSQGEMLNLVEAALKFITRLLLLGEFNRFVY